MPSSGHSLDTLVPGREQAPGAFPSSPTTPGFAAQRHLAREVYERRHEYVKTKQLRIKIGSWNVAANAGTEKDIQGWFVDGKGISKLHGGLHTGAKTEDDAIEDAACQEERVTSDRSTIPYNDESQLPKHEDIDIYALGLQEIIDINSAAEALRPYNDAGPANRWKDAVGDALPEGYVLIAEQQLLGLLILVYASPTIALEISSVSTTSVGTGLMGYMGNKGAVAARLVLSETTKLVFVNSHLAAGNDKASLERRNWDASQIIQRTRFAPIDHGYGVVDELGDYVGAEDFAFWFGDLNYRLADIPGDDVRRLLLLHSRNEYNEDDEARKSIDKELNIKADAHIPSPQIEDLEPLEDPASALTTITSLMTHDQLHAQMKQRKAFHQGWQEGPISFLPTYKYDVGSIGMFDTSEKKRSPSWCDRILYRTRQNYKSWLAEEKELEQTKKRDQEMKARGLENVNDEVIFDYDPEADGEDTAEPNANEESSKIDNFRAYEETNADSQASIELEYYVSHQRVLSSDHKPLDAIFSIEYNAVDPELKSKVHQEIAKEIDRQENEGRPSVTAIFESSDLYERSSDGCRFGELSFYQEKVVLLTVANTSPVVATFEFLDKGSDIPTPTWLRLVDHDEAGDRLHRKPLKAITLQPGDSTNIEVIALVDQLQDLQAFNERTATPDTILVMRVRKGRDHFIPVHADWKKTSFGLSIDNLVLIGKEGVRNNNRAEMDGVRGSAPKELFRLTEALEENLSAVISHEDALNMIMAKGPDWPFISRPIELAVRDPHLLSIREALDTATTFSLEEVGILGRVELLGETIVLFLSYIPNRIIPQQLWSSLSSSLLDYEKGKQPLRGEDLRARVLDVLTVSPPASVSFTFITFMLARIATELTPEPSGQDDTPVPDTPLSPTTPMTLFKRARGLTLKESAAARRRQIQNAFAEKFVLLIFEADPSLSSAKARLHDHERKKAILMAFLRSHDEE